MHQHAFLLLHGWAVSWFLSVMEVQVYCKMMACYCTNKNQQIAMVPIMTWHFRNVINERPGCLVDLSPHPIRQQKCGITSHTLSSKQTNKSKRRVNNPPSSVCFLGEIKICNLHKHGFSMVTWVCWSHAPVMHHRVTSIKNTLLQQVDKISQKAFISPVLWPLPAVQYLFTYFYLW